MSTTKIQALELELQKEREARLAAELIVEEKDLEIQSVNENLVKLLDKKTLDYKDFFENLVDSYILMDLFGNVLKMNQAAVNFFGYNSTKEKFNVLNIIYKDDYEYAIASFYELVEKGTFNNYEARIVTKPGEIKWVQINSSIVKDNKGIPVFAQGIVRDITKEKEQQEIFEEQKRQLNAIVDNSSLGIVLSHNMKILKSNLAFQKLLNYSEEELSKLEIKDISLPEDKEISYKYMNKLMTGELANFSINKRYKTKKGKIIWAKTSVAGVKDESGKVKYQVALVEDITEELKREALLEALNSLMVSILGKTNIYEIAWEITKNTADLLGFEDCVIYLLEKEKGILKQIAALGGKVVNDEEIVNQMHIKLGEGIVGHVAKTGIAEIISDTSKDKRYKVDDKVRYSEVTVPIVANNEIIGIIDSEHSSKNFYTKDHLETLKTIAGLAATQLKSALNHQEKLTTEKEKEKLLKDLTKSNQELKDFAHVVSHDLKSPLRSMNALVTWLQEDCEEFTNETIDNHFKSLLKKIDKMDDLINGILTYASIDKLEKQTKRINLDELVNEVIEILFVPDHISITINNKLPIVAGDKFRLQQVFQNLISNAIKYSDKEKGIILVDCEEKENFWEFSIKDNGKGISKKYFKKIFEVFESLEETEDSTGVGLSIVKKIIAFYGGNIRVESEVNKGATFYFTLPK